MKNLIEKTTKDGNIDKEEFLEGLLELRNTPQQHGLSPAEIVYGHPTRTKLPMHSSLFSKRWAKMDLEWDKRRSLQVMKQNKWYNANAKPLNPLKIGSQVRI